MAVFKCKMCGGTIEFGQGETVGVCDSCGTKQTLPRLDNDKKENLYDRANHFRRNNNFDKAMGIYEQILNEDPSDAEAYWSLVLCRYGIEYVEDPTTHKRVPTVNRAQFTSIFADEDYKSAIEYADAAQRAVYEAEAEAIDGIQKGILEISSKEKPFDVFICYKETDSAGKRTPDSVLANDLYHQLTKEGFKVFFSRITLEDKLGTEYEPYIFAALNSAKVMVVLGTKPEYFNAVWVKNEWSRFLMLVKKSDGEKMLIPAYKDMDPYDLPEEFSHLQAQDMSKLGFMQDLIRGIKKIVRGESPSSEKPQKPSETENSNPLLKRAFLFLEDGEFDAACNYTEKVLDKDPECGEAYLLKLLAELRLKTKDELYKYPKDFSNSNNYKYALRFGNSELKKYLKNGLDSALKIQEEIRVGGIYKNAKLKQSTFTEENLRQAARMFASIPFYKDSQEQKEECLKQAEEVKKDKIYYAGKVNLDKGERISSLKEQDLAIADFNKIPDWKDSKELIEKCGKIKNRIKKFKKAKKITALSVLGLAVVISLSILLYNFVIVPNGKYNDAMALYKEKKYTEAIFAFQDISGFGDSREMIDKIYSEKYGEEAWAKVKDSTETEDSLFFGFYEQDNNKENGKEPIEWIVIDKTDNAVLLLSRYALDYMQYNSEAKDITWENCSLRKWLNEDFFQSAFNETEQAFIIETAVLADQNPKYTTSPGITTRDKVFLLSGSEAESLSKEIRKCKKTEYAKTKTDQSVSGAYYWLRTPGTVQNFSSIINPAGSIFYFGEVITYYNGVRPAMWISLNAAAAQE